VKAYYNDHYGLSQSIFSWVQVIILKVKISRKTKKKIGVIPH